MRRWFRIVIQIFILWLILLSGNFIAGYLKLPLPGNVLGMLILFALLSLRIVPVAWVEDGAGFLLKHLAFFFIPIAVGLMAWGDLFITSGFKLILILTVGAVLSLIATGWVAQFLDGIKKEGGQRGS